MTGVLRPAEHEVTSIQTQTAVILRIKTVIGDVVAIELDDQSMWPVLEPLLSFWSRLEQAAGPFEPTMAQETLPF